MSTIYGKTYSNPKNINLKQGLLRFDKTHSSNPYSTDDEGWGLSINSSDQLVYWDGSSESILGSINGYVTTLGTSDLILDTNEGTNTGSITIADGVAGDITVAINGAGNFNVQNLAYQTNVGSPVTTTATLTWGDAEGQVVFCTSAGGAYTLTLPTVASVGAGGWYTFIKNDADANAITIAGSGAETINGSNTYASIDADYDTVTIQCDGIEWFITSEKLA